MAETPDYAKWIVDALRADARLSRAGLARHLGHGSDRSRVTKMIAGERRIRVDEIPEIAAYLGVQPPGLTVKSSVESLGLPLIGMISKGFWTEPGMRQPTTVAIPASPDPRYPVTEQTACEMGEAATSECMMAGDYVITVPFRFDRQQPQPSDLIVGLRKRDGLEQLTLVKAVGAHGRVDLVPVIDGAPKNGDPGSPYRRVIGLWRSIG